MVTDLPLIQQNIAFQLLEKNTGDEGGWKPKCNDTTCSSVQHGRQLSPLCYPVYSLIS